jgi:hypothetical protein
VHPGGLLVDAAYSTMGQHGYAAFDGVRPLLVGDLDWSDVQVDGEQPQADNDHGE